MVLQMPDPWFFCIYILFSWSLWTRLPWGNIIWRDNSKEVERSESMADEGTLELLNWVGWIHPQVYWHFHIPIQCDKQGSGRGTKQAIQERDVRVWSRITLILATNNSSNNQLGLIPMGHCTSLRARKHWRSTSADVVNWFCNGELLAHIWSHGVEGWWRKDASEDHIDLNCPCMGSLLGIFHSILRYGDCNFLTVSLIISLVP